MGRGAANRTLRQAQGELKKQLGLAAGEALKNPGVSSQIKTVPAEVLPSGRMNKGGTAEAKAPAPLRTGAFCLGKKMYHPTLDELKKLKNQGNLAPVYREIQADLDTPVSAYLKIARGKYSFLLESVEGGERLARYSFLGAEPSKVISTRGGKDPLALIEKEFKKYKQV